jgi:hypothetical protein
MLMTHWQEKDDRILNHCPLRQNFGMVTEFKNYRGSGSQKKNAPWQSFAIGTTSFLVHRLKLQLTPLTLM